MEFTLQRFIVRLCMNRKFKRILYQIRIRSHLPVVIRIERLFQNLRLFLRVINRSDLKIIVCYIRIRPVKLRILLAVKHIDIVNVVHVNRLIHVKPIFFQQRNRLCKLRVNQASVITVIPHAMPPAQIRLILLGSQRRNTANRIRVKHHIKIKQPSSLE